MRRSLSAIAAVGALVALTAAPAGAQETLGFEVDKTEGSPGEIVAGQVDTDDVAEHCVTELEAFQERFSELLDVVGFGGPLSDRFLPEDATNPFEPVETHDQLAYLATIFVVLGLSGILGDDEPAENALPQTFVMTFADIATQEPVGEMGNFDPDTGEGSVVVPDIDPGFWAVAAACIGPTFDLDALEAGIRASGVFLEELGAPADGNPIINPEFVEFAQAFLDSEATGLPLFTEFVTAIGPDLLQNIVEPDALGFVIFCILDAEGECPDGPPDEVDVDDVEPPTAVAVVAEPVFTG